MTRLEAISRMHGQGNVSLQEDTPIGGCRGRAQRLIKRKMQ